MRKISFYASSFLLLLISCKKEEKGIEKIDFKTEYKFSSEIEAQLEKDTVPWKYQVSASEYALKGDYKNALTHWDKTMGMKQKNYSIDKVDSIKQKYSIVNAKDYILEQAKSNQVIIINEAHHNSFHRTFTKSLLKELYDLGYKNLGLEALSNKENIDSLTTIRKYPTQNTGYYIRDPSFGKLIREAIDIGYTLFPYETTDEEANGKPREIDQAKNIQKVIETKPNEKFLIHCGYDHALEGNHEYWEKAMAGRLTEYTGINPFTINQVVYSEYSRPEFSEPLLRAFDISESSIIIDKEGNPLRYEENATWTDLAIFHPNTTYISQRPHWLFENGNKNVSIKLEDIPIEFPVMILAFKKGEDIQQAVPLDITEVNSKVENGHLGLKRGTYNIVITNGKKSYKFEKLVE